MTNEIQQHESHSDLWTDLDRVFDELRERRSGPWDVRAFGPIYARLGPADGRFLRAARTDVTDTGTSYKIVAEVPGIPKDKLDIRVRGTSVEIRGENSEASEKKDGEFVHRERTYAGYFRQLELPEGVVAAEARAKVENGLLELELPKEHPSPANGEVRVAVA